MERERCPDLAALRQVLRRLGVEWRFRHEGFCTVLAVCDGERHVGHGLDENDALLDLARRLFPTAPARALLDEALEGAPPEEGSPPAPGVAPEEPADDASPPPPPAAPEPSALDVVRTLLPPPPPRRPGLPRPPPRRPPSRTLVEDLDELAELAEEIEEGITEFAFLAPDRQRLVLLRWIALARALQDERPRNDRVRAAVLRVARRVERLAKLAWPGTVRALRLDAYPDECRVEIGGPLPRLRTWLEVVDAVDEELLRRAEAGEERGLGPTGWADEPALDPTPADPHGDLRRALKVVQRITRTDPFGKPPAKKTYSSIPKEEREDLLETARLLRWLRGADVDPLRWLQAFGRLRWFVERAPKVAARSLGRQLDPEYAPRTTWAQVFGYDPRRRDRRLRRRERLAALEGLDGGDARALAAWIVSVDETDLDAARLAAVLSRFRDEVLALDPKRQDLFPERRHRRRVKNIQERLRRGGLAAAPCAEVVPDAAARGGVDVEEPTAQERLEERVREWTRGKRALLVLNRKDPELVETLSEVFALADLDAAEFTPHRLDGLAERVLHGSYDLLLSATGFQSHEVERKLKKACRAVDVPYVRVNKARRVASVRAVARELGLASEPEPATGRASAEGVAQSSP